MERFYTQTKTLANGETRTYTFKKIVVGRIPGVPSSKCLLRKRFKELTNDDCAAILEMLNERSATDSDTSLSEGDSENEE
jgi:hypothetical protein